MKRILAWMVLIFMILECIIPFFDNSTLLENSAFRSLAEIEADDVEYLDDEAIALSDVSDTNTALRAEALKAYNLVNEQREAAGLSSLSWDSNLESTSSVRSQECSISFSHTRPNGKAWYPVNSNIQGMIAQSILAANEEKMAKIKESTSNVLSQIEGMSEEKKEKIYKKNVTEQLKSINECMKSIDETVDALNEMYQTTYKQHPDMNVSFRNVIGAFNAVKLELSNHAYHSKRRLEYSEVNGKIKRNDNVRDEDYANVIDPSLDCAKELKKICIYCFFTV